MRNFPLTIKIWFALSLVSLLLYLMFLLIIPYMVRNHFTNPMLNTPLNPKKPPPHEFSREGARYFPVRQFIVMEDGSTIPDQAGGALPPSLMEEINQRGKAQDPEIQRYVYESNQVRYIYAIRKDQAYGRQMYQINILTQSDERRFVQGFLLQFMYFAGGALLVSWFASVFIARYLTRPLITIKEHVERIAGRDWHKPLEVNHNDEFGQLSQSIESMRRQLLQQESVQQSMLQNISHELKTPVMIIRSYAQAIQEGLYPKGDLAGSIKVVDEEGARLEKLIGQLLYLTRLDYLSAQKPQYNNIFLSGLIEEIIERIRYNRLDMEWVVNLRPVDVRGDEERWRVLIENVLDNHLRHAVTSIGVDLTVDCHDSDGESKKVLRLDIWNDGSVIDPRILGQVFQPFQKGREGRYGLGLVIAKRIVTMFKGEIRIYNGEDDRGGVHTEIKVPLDN